ncbi:MAG: hypothetical protein ACM3PY_16350, partial [Omnitrophica WOR_2 bacterium]
RFWKPYGLPANPGLDAPQGSSVYIPWNALIGEGLVSYNYRQEAAELFKRIMAAILQSLKQEGAFRRHYDAETGRGTGERNALEGLAPLHLFLQILGVQLVSPSEVVVSGYNPFPWPVTVKYQGLRIMRQMEKTIIIFPDGQTTTVAGQDPKQIILR